MKNFGIILSGCGVYDGSEIHETVLTMLAIAQQDSTYTIFAPNVEQMHVINHVTGEVTEEKRNIMVEAARIARGNIQPLSEFDAAKVDGLIIPGGFGAAKNFCTYAVDGVDCKVNPEVEKAVKDMVALKKPIGGLCIAPVLLTRILKQVEVTIGQDEATAGDIEKLGGKNIMTNHGDVVIDKQKNVFTTPCYMLKSTIAQVAEDAENLVKAMLNYM